MFFSRCTGNELRNTMNKVTTLDVKLNIKLRMRHCSFIYFGVSPVTRDSCGTPDRGMTFPVMVFFFFLPSTSIQPLASFRMSPARLSGSNRKFECFKSGIRQFLRLSLSSWRSTLVFLSFSSLLQSLRVKSCFHQFHSH